MGKRRYIKFKNGCMITKIAKKGRKARVTMKCPKSMSKNKFEILFNN